MNLYLNGRFLTQAASGVQRYARCLVRELDRVFASDASYSGWSVTLVCPPNAPDWDELRHIRVRKVGRLHGQAWEQVELPRYTQGGLLVSLGNTSAVVKWRQVVVIHDVAPFANRAGFSMLFRTWYRILLPLLARVARRVITVSEFSAGEITEYLGVSPGKLRVVYNAAEHLESVEPDHGILERNGLGERRYVLTVGNDAPYKNLAVVGRAQQLLGEIDCEFVHAGGALPGVFGAPGGSGSARYRPLGYVTDSELRALYQRAACFVFPSVYEGFGIPPLEAMAEGCPVIASTAASIPEVCSDAALYFDPGNAAELAEAITSVLSDEQLRSDLVRRGERRSRSFSWRSSADAMLQVITEMA